MSRPRRRQQAPVAPSTSGVSTSTAAQSSTYWAASNASPEWIDARFERAVDMVQSLPKSGPIQTSYEDKLLLYSVYKQATEGNVKSARPGMLDVLGRAKWDAWNKRKDLSFLDAKRLYVDSLVKILKGYSDRPQAVALIKELQTFSLDPKRMVMSGSTAARSESESSTDSESNYRSVRQAPPPRASTSRLDRPPAGGDRHQSSHSSTRGPPISSVAPSLPGYGPPRTGADTPRQGSPYSSEASSSGDEMPPPAGYNSRGNFQTPQTHLHGHAGQQVYPTPTGAPTPNRAFSPPPIGTWANPPLSAPFSPDQGSVRGMGQQVGVQYPVGTLRPIASASMGGISSLAGSRQAAPAGPSTSTAPANAPMERALDRIQTTLQALNERLAELETRERAAREEAAAPSEMGQVAAELWVRLAVFLGFASRAQSLALARRRARGLASGRKLLGALLGSLIRLLARGVRDGFVLLAVVGLLSGGRVDVFRTLGRLLFAGARGRRRELEPPPAV